MKIYTSNINSSHSNNKLWNFTFLSQKGWMNCHPNHTNINIKKTWEFLLSCIMNQLCMDRKSVTNVRTDRQTIYYVSACNASNGHKVAAWKCRNTALTCNFQKNTTVCLILFSWRVFFFCFHECKVRKSLYHILRSGHA